VEEPRKLPLDILAELRTSVAHLATGLADMRQEFRTDIRRLDERVFQLMLAQSPRSRPHSARFSQRSCPSA